MITEIWYMGVYYFDIPTLWIFLDPFIFLQVKQ